jgi:pimeloyl-ACP methyl ester carboxylesterase
MKRTLAVLPIVVTVVLAGCRVSSDESVAESPPPNATFKAAFVPAGGVMPFPNDLFFSGSADGTVNMPVIDPTDTGDYLVAINALDGYSTTAPIFVPFTGPIDAASITAATVRMVNVTGAPAPLTFGTHYTAGVSPAVDGTNQLMITPLAPLAAKGRYAIIVTRGITSGGTAAVADTTMQALLDIHTAGATPPASLTALYNALDPAMDLANGLGVADSNIAVVATFATQSTLDVLADVNTDAVAGTALAVSIDRTNKELLDPTNANAAVLNRADVYAGFISVPYMVSRTNPLGGRWQTATGGEVTRYTALAGAGPAVTETLNVPMLVAIPNGGTKGGSVAAKPVAGWPVVIFQHGITGNRSNMIAIAQAMAGAGFAVVAIDHPLHGLPVGHPLRITIPGVTITEPTFDLDLVNNTSGAAGADGTADSSGTHFINLPSLLTSRDNIRQSAANLIRLAKTVPNLSYDGVAGGDFDASRMHFIGHSLGGIVGTTFLGVSTDVQAGSLHMPGGTISRLLRDSATFGPRINAGLAASGVIAGSQLYEQFMQAAQTVADAADPINFAAAANANHSLHLIQVVGGGGNNPDQVVPNSATARLIAALGLAKRTAAGVNLPDGYVNFTAGGHSSNLDPTVSAAATVEMQTQTANFIGSDGAAIVITNTAVIDTTP